MGRDEVMTRLSAARSAFDERVAAVPAGVFEAPLPGSPHSPKDVVAHITAYEELIVERLVAARHGATTAFDRDREGWEAFNERVWREAEAIRADRVLRRSREVFAALLRQVEALTDEELEAPVGATAALDPAWLEGKAPWELIAIDAYDHYPMHFAGLEAAAATGR